MTRWFNPGLLFLLIVRAIVSATFGAYADRRPPEQGNPFSGNPVLVF
jgi:hypothetical protein